MGRSTKTPTSCRLPPTFSLPVLFQPCILTLCYFIHCFIHCASDVSDSFIHAFWGCLADILTDRDQEFSIKLDQPVEWRTGENFHLQIEGFNTVANSKVSFISNCIINKKMLGPNIAQTEYMIWELRVFACGCVWKAILPGERIPALYLKAAFLATDIRKINSLLSSPV